MVLFIVHIQKILALSSVLCVCTMFHFLLILLQGLYLLYCNRGLLGWFLTCFCKYYRRPVIVKYNIKYGFFRWFHKDRIYSFICGGASIWGGVNIAYLFVFSNTSVKFVTLLLLLECGSEEQVAKEGRNTMHSGQLQPWYIGKVRWQMRWN